MGFVQVFDLLCYAVLILFKDRHWEFFGGKGDGFLLCDLIKIPAFSTLSFCFVSFSVTVMI